MFPAHTFEDDTVFCFCFSFAIRSKCAQLIKFLFLAHEIRHVQLLHRTWSDNSAFCVTENDKYPCTCFLLFTGCVNQERKLEMLRKKEVDNVSEYLARKEDRMGKKRVKNKQSDRGDFTTQASCLEKMSENGAKRPRLETWTVKLLRFRNNRKELNSLVVWLCARFNRRLQIC